MTCVEVSWALFGQILKVWVFYLYFLYITTLCNYLGQHRVSHMCSGIGLFKELYAPLLFYWSGWRFESDRLKKIETDGQKKICKYTQRR